MAQLVVNGATIMCTFGATPSSLTVLPTRRVLAEGQPAANILDSQPVVNVVPFALCTSLANPTVASATAAAGGVLTPMPCTPVTSAPWVPGSPTVLIGEAPALTSNSTCQCAYGGVVSVASPGQFTVQAP